MPLNSLKENFMLTKIKNALKKVTTVEWIVLGVAVLALWVGLTRCTGNGHKGHHKADKAVEAAVEVK
jgi:hypothetical protein